MDSKTYISSLENHGKDLYDLYKPFRVKVPLGKSGPWTVRRFRTEMNIAYLRFARDGRAPGLGEFTALNHKNRGIVMSDTCPEINDVKPYLYDLKGDVLITGLGLGMVPHILTKVQRFSTQVKSITIIEKDADVIKLTAEHYIKSDRRIKIIHADALTLTLPKGSNFDSAWHDIWDEICEDNRQEMTAMRRNYQRFVTKGKQFCWGQHTMDQMKRRERDGS